MPDAAKAHTKAGAAAFVTYFWQVVHYAENTGDVAALKSTFADGCMPCGAGAAGITAIYRAGGRIVGGGQLVAVTRVALSYAGPFLLADLAVTVTNGPERVDYPGRLKDEERPPAVVHDHFHLRRTDDDHWRVTGFEMLR